MSPHWVWWLRDLPARIVDRAGFAYALLLAAGALACLVTVAVWTVLVLAGYPLP